MLSWLSPLLDAAPAAASSLSDFNILDFILHIDRYLNYIVADYQLWAYAIIFVVIFCETGLVITPFLPGDSLIFAAGALTATAGCPLSLHWLSAVIFAAAVLGDGCNYMIGHFFGTKLFSNPHSKIFKQEYLEKTHNFYRKYGGKTIILARFVPIVRTFAPFVAGMGKMHYYYFMIYNTTGALLWVLLFACLGHFFGSVSFVKDHFGVVAIAIVVLSLMPAIIEILRAKLAKGREKSA